MAATTPQGAKLLHGLQKSDRFKNGTAALLPRAYRKFYDEWKAKPTAVHYIPKEGSWERDIKTGIVTPVQNVPIPVIYPPEHNLGIWGGEGVVKGFQKRTPTKKRVPHYWVPVLRRTVVYSAVLNKYLSMIVTDRTMDLIHESRGFDHYLLKTPACDLKSAMAFKIKRKILQALQAGCPDVDPQRKTEILEEYLRYVEQYTEEEIEWYGYTFYEAITKMNLQLAKDREELVVPHKIEFRSKLIQQLKEAGIAEAQESVTEGSSQSQLGSSSWLNKMNPFGKKQQT